MQNIKHECLAHFIGFGQDHFRQPCTEFVTWYNQERPHQAKDNLPLKKTRGRKWKETDLASAVVFTSRLGGLLKHYHRRAA